MGLQDAREALFVAAFDRDAARLSDAALPSAFDATSTIRTTGSERRGRASPRTHSLGSEPVTVRRRAVSHGTAEVRGYDFTRPHRPDSRFRAKRDRALSRSWPGGGGGGGPPPPPPPAPRPAGAGRGPARRGGPPPPPPPP
ncbi:hypothetical protein, partial [Nocardia abscessus]|uniref:hypothetical protein n=1 Tax=Nocardia abscessus TaxID=120957 RepID=UPI0024557DA6